MYFLKVLLHVHIPLHLMAPASQKAGHHDLLGLNWSFISLALLKEMFSLAVLLFPQKISNQEEKSLLSVFHTVIQIRSLSFL